MGWRKTLAARRLLSRLKEVFTEYNDLSFQYCIKQYQAFEQSADEILFLHVREPKEIHRLKQYIGSSCRTLLIRRPDVSSQHYGNHSDDDVESYAYDLYFDNLPPLETLPERVKKFFEKI